MTELRITALDSVLDLAVEAPWYSPIALRLACAWSRCVSSGPPGSVARIAEPLTVAAPIEAGDESLHATLQHVTQEVTRRLIACQTGKLLMLHAGAVSHPGTGESLVFVARGGTGKPTLARTLGRHYGYITDETVGMDFSGRIHPYPKPLSMRSERGRAKRETSPDDLGLLASHPSPTVGRIVVLARSGAHDGPLHLEELGVLDAIVSLTPETSGLNRLREPFHRRRCQRWPTTSRRCSVALPGVRRRRLLSQWLPS